MFTRVLWQSFNRSREKGSYSNIRICYSSQKEPSEMKKVFLNFRQNSQENTCVEVSFDTGVFLVKFANYFLVQNAYGRLLLSGGQG